MRCRLAVVVLLVAAAAAPMPRATNAAARGAPQVPPAQSVEQHADLAERLMRRAMRVVRERRDAAAIASPERTGIATDSPEMGPGAPVRAEAGSARAETADLDPDRAALIGVEYSPVMTTMGSLESKKLATDPRWARALVRQLHDHGVGSGSTVLASFSGSFPGLNIAVMAACRALDARLIAVSSVTASTWGADEPGLTWPEMESAIVRSGVMPAASAAITLGGTRDAARDLTEEGRAMALGIQKSTAASLGATALSSSSLAEAIALRLTTYRAVMAPARPSVYVNVGGNHASLGGARAELRHEEGWILSRPAGADASASVILAWLVEGVPVLNLLDIKSLAKTWGLQ